MLRINKAVLLSIVLSAAAIGVAVVKCKRHSNKNPAVVAALALAPQSTSSTPVQVAMVTVPGGTFQRDSTATNTSTVSTFQMGQSEITRGQFRAVMGYDPSDTSYSNSPGTDDPVQNVSWYEAIVFCNKLSMSHGLVPVYSIVVNGVASTDPADWGPIPTLGPVPTAWSNVAWNNAANGFRLPSRMEWIWAAMGATSDARAGDMVGGINTGGYTKGYSGSTESASATSNLASYAWFSSNGGSKSHPVGGIVHDRQPNELGLYDMSGNVWEWCYGVWGTFPSGPLTDYRGLGTTGIHPYVGGSWAYNELSTYILGFGDWDTAPVPRRYDIGFRVARQ